MDLSTIKMVVTDMDGTLLNSNHQVSDEFYKIFKILKEKQILFVAASGRQYHSIIEKLNPIKDDIIVIAENGGYAVSNNKEILSTPLPTKHKENVLNTLKSIKDINVVLCGKTCAYATGESNSFTEKLKEFYSSFGIIEDLNQHKGEILKIAIHYAGSSEEYIYPKVKHLQDQLQLKVSGENWLDISTEKANKGDALKVVMNLHNITKEEILVFGDYNNDIEMLTLAQHSYAMENAHKNVKAVANFETTSNDNLGVERILQKLIDTKNNL